MDRFPRIAEKNPESEEVGHKIEAIARSICSALRRTGQNINEQSTGQNSAAQMREPAGKEQRPEEIERRNEDNKKPTETTSADTSREWRAEFSNRGWNSFSIHFWQADEHHKLEFKGSLWLPVESLELDGVTIKRYLRRGRKKEVFAVGTHKDHFELRFRSKSYLRLSDIEFCFDNRPILSSK